MFSIFRPAVPVGNQLRTMINFAGCDTPMQVRALWSFVQDDVLAPNGVKAFSAAELPGEGADAARIDAFKKDVTDRVRPALDRRVSRFFRGGLNERKLDQGRFGNGLAVATIGRNAAKMGIISRDPASLMVGAGIEMASMQREAQDELRAITPSFAVSVTELSAMSAVAAVGELLLYNTDYLGGLAAARYGTMVLLAVAYLRYMLKRVPEVVDRDR